MKAVLPAAGFGTRFLPITKAVPKELLPVGAKPVIQYVVEEAVAAGFDEVLVIISPEKEIIRRYFEPAPAIEAHLDSIGKSSAADDLRSLHQMANFTFAYQPKMRGLGDAILCARDFAGDDSFAVLLADTIIHGTSPLPAMQRAMELHGLASVAVEPCPTEKVGRYGIAGGVEQDDGNFALNSMIEKPDAPAAPVIRRRDGSLAHFAFAARYLFTPAIFPALEKCQPGVGGEIQLTDAMRCVLESHGFLGAPSGGQRLDIGNPSGLLAAQQLVVGSRP